jgi:hypothetical protein
MYSFFPERGDFISFLLLDVGDVDVVAVAVVVLALVFVGLFGCPVVFLVGLTYRLPLRC